MTDYTRVYRWLIRLYPHAFRAAYEEEMVRLLADVLAEAGGNRRAALGVFLHAAGDVIWTASRQHLEREVPVARPASGPTGTPTVASSTRRNALLVSSLPLWLTLLLSLIAPGYMDPIFANPPAILGLPAGVLVVTAALVWASMGLWLVWQRGGSVAVLLLAMVLFVAPATLAVVLAPASILILQNLAV